MNNPDPITSDLEDSILLSRLATGDDDAISRFLAKHAQALRRLAISLDPNQDNADDLVGACIHQLVSSTPLFETTAHFFAWAKTTLTNLHIDRLVGLVG